MGAAESAVTSVLTAAAFCGTWMSQPCSSSRLYSLRTIFMPPSRGSFFGLDDGIVEEVHGGYKPCRARQGY